jgi:hypothetical protein
MKIKFLSLTAAIIFLSIAGYILFSQNQKNDFSLPVKINELRVVSIDGESIDIANKSNEKSIIVLLDDNCSPCIDKLFFLDYFSHIYKHKVEFHLIWNDTIPKAKLSEFSYLLGNSYTLDSPERFSYTPYAVFVEGAEVTHIDFDLMNISTIMESEVTTDEIKEKTFEYFIRKYNLIEESFDIVFNTDGCSACDEVRSKLMNTKEQLETTLLITPNNSNFENTLIDTKFYFSELFEIDLFPKILEFRSGDISVIDPVQQ